MEVICDIFFWLNSGCKEVINFLMKWYPHRISKLENLGLGATALCRQTGLWRAIREMRFHSWATV